MANKNLLLKLQEKHHEGGYALIEPKTGQVVAFADDIKILYQTIERKKIRDADKLVMYVPPPKVKHVFQISL